MDYDLPVLPGQLVQTYNDSVLRDVCFELRVDYDIINGGDKSDKARELLTYLDRRGRLTEQKVDVYTADRASTSTPLHTPKTPPAPSQSRHQRC